MTESNKSLEPLSMVRHPNLVMLSDTPKGRGIFAQSDISSGTTIETCPVLVLPIHENEAHIKQTILFHYTYNWPVTLDDGNKATAQAVVFGLGSMFNHAQNQNVGWIRDLDRSVITYTTLRDIAAGEELCISYGDRLTFKDADPSIPADEGDESDLLSSINVDIS